MIVANVSSAMAEYIKPDSMMMRMMFLSLPCADFAVPLLMRYFLPELSTLQIRYTSNPCEERERKKALEMGFKYRIPSNSLIPEWLTCGDDIQSDSDRPEESDRGRELFGADKHPRF
jgi:hypothetical protein